MTRRHLFKLFLSGSAGTTACSRSNVAILAKLNHMATSEDLAIIDTLIPQVITVISPRDRELILPIAPGRLSVALDGSWLAWFPSGQDVYPASRDSILVYFTDRPRSAHKLELAGRYGAQLAISSKAAHLAVVVVAGTNATTRLVVLKPTTGELEHDVTEVIKNFNLKDTERLRFSANGNRLVAGSPSSFSLVDLPSRKLVLEGQGRFPSISPSGELLAFIDHRRRLNLVKVTSGISTPLLDRLTVHGVGSWTPDGSLLFAAVEPELSLYCYLTAVDCSADAYAEIRRLEEHDSGQDCGVIMRRLLTPKS